MKTLNVKFLRLVMRKLIQEKGIVDKITFRLNAKQAGELAELQDCPAIYIFHTKYIKLNMYKNSMKIIGHLI